MHGAALMREMRALRPELAFEGIGGPSMASLGQEQMYEMAALSLVGATEVLSSLPRILRMFKAIKRRLREQPPEALILIDAPDFNFRLARMAHGLGIPVYYYISPQVWAWRSGRVKFLQKYCRKVLCILPFEQEFYSERGVDVEFVGHPLLDELPLAELDALERDPWRIGILPGSRKKEIAALLPEFAATAGQLVKEFPELKFIVVRAPGVELERLQALWPENVPVEYVDPDERYRAMAGCAFLLASSGTATLEAALLGTPCVVGYKMSGLSMFLARRLVNVEHISLPNLILGRKVFPELLQDEVSPEVMVPLAKAWLTDGEALEGVRLALRELRQRMGEPGAPGRAARAIVESMREEAG